MPATHVGRHCDTTKEFLFPWRHVICSLWKRYPNPWSGHVLSEDVYERYITSDGCLFTKRLLEKTNRLPPGGSAFVKSPKLYIIEESYIDPQRNVAVTYTHNIGLQRVMNFHEKVVYAPANSPDTTLVHRSGSVICSMYGFRSLVERVGIERFKRNVIKAEKGLACAVLREFQPSLAPTPDAMPDQRGHKWEELLGRMKWAREAARERAKEMLERANRIGSLKSTAAKHASEIYGCSNLRRPTSRQTQ